MVRTWDIFCSVVDNFGDIGVCWRLARQLAAERAQSVRLWVDDLASLNRLCHAADASSPRQRVAGVEIRNWDRRGDAPWQRVEVADIVIEGFGVRLPHEYLAAMAARPVKPVWINLEYLSAEDWVASCHALPSPQPDGPLTKYFFFPGFSEATGGLIVERGLAAARDAFQADAAAVAAFRRRLVAGDMPAHAERLWLSLFCYENAALPALIDAWSQGPARLACVVPEGRALQQLSAILGRSLTPGARVDLGQGALCMLAVPFLEQDDYDRLLWASDVNLVRGEDSFVRAQLAARPMIWQAYPQADDAHLAKMSAFLRLYSGGLDVAPAAAACGMFELWNRQSTAIAKAWSDFGGQLPALQGHAAAWAGRLASGPNLAERLAQFCENKLK